MQDIVLEEFLPIPHTCRSRLRMLDIVYNGPCTEKKRKGERLKKIFLLAASFHVGRQSSESYEQLAGGAAQDGRQNPNFT